MPSIAEVLGPCDTEFAFSRLRFDEEGVKKSELMGELTRKAEGREGVTAQAWVWKQDQGAGDVRNVGD